MVRPDLQRLIADASALLCAVLDNRQGALEPPIRSEIFGPRRFAQHGFSLGASHRAGTSRAQSHLFFPRLNQNILMLRQAQRYIGAQTASGHDISPAAEWLIDNAHLIEAQLKEIHEALPHHYFRRLPVLMDAPLVGLPRIYGVAWAFVAHTDSAFDEDLLMQFLIAYQGARELSMSEMWALPTTLRVVLIENLRRLAERVATQQAAREAANLCCDRIETHTLHALDELHALMALRGASEVFLTQMAVRLQDGPLTGHVRQHARYQGWLHKAVPDLAAMQAQQNADQTADNLSVSNAVTSLRAIGDADWSEIVAGGSALMQLMLGSEVFKAEHPRSRDLTLHAIEALARRSERSEVSVATTLLGLMRGADPGADPDDAPAALASHWLRGRGRPQLVHALGLREPGAQAWRWGVRHLTLPLYLGALLFGTLAVLGALMQHRVAMSQMSPMWLSVAGLWLMSVPASEAVSASTQSVNKANWAWGSGLANSCSSRRCTSARADFRSVSKAGTTTMTRRSGGMPVDRASRGRWRGRRDSLMSRLTTADTASEAGTAISHRPATPPAPTGPVDGHPARTPRHGGRPRLADRPEVGAGAGAPH